MKDYEQREVLNQLAGYSRHDWLTSYDAIIPLIQKQNRSTKSFVEREVFNRINSTCLFDATPAQLCEALLRATGKWKE